MSLKTISTGMHRTEIILKFINCMKIKLLYTLVFSLLIINSAFSQNEDDVVIDQVVAVVGRNIVKLSDIESQYQEALMQGVKSPKGDLKCDVFEELLTQKLLLNQARLDSIEVGDSEVELELERRMDHFINQAGSIERLESYFNKSMLKIKEDLRDNIRELMLAQRMQASIVGDIKITPSEVRNFYKKIPQDSIPKIEATVRLNQIAVYPPESDEAIFEVKEKLLQLRQRILNGENFSALAVLYSEGPSATNGGEIGYLGKGQLDPEYAKAAFSLKEGGVSKIVQSEFGFHIIQLIDRRENKVNTRHILMKPKVSSESLEKAQARLDSIAEMIRLDSLTFEQAARYFSEDEDTRLSGGQMINMHTGNAYFQMNHLDKSEFQIIRQLKVGEMTDPFLTEDVNSGRKVFKIIKLAERTDPHLANLVQDYDLLKNMAMSEKQQEIVQEWIKEKIKTTYVSIDDSYANCAFSMSGWKK